MELRGGGVGLDGHVTTNNTKQRTQGTVVERQITNTQHKQHNGHRLSLKMASLLMFALFLIVAIPRGEAIRCWKCTSNSDHGCNDPFDNKTIHQVDCTNWDRSGGHIARYCSKFTSEVNGRMVYYRSCSHTEGLCPDAISSGTCTTCSDNLCNSAPQVRLGSAGVLTMATALAVALALHRPAFL